MKLKSLAQMLLIICANLFCANARGQIIITVAGNGTAGYSGNGFQATSATLDDPEGITIDRHGNIFIADKNNSCIRKIVPSGIISTYAGTGIAGYSGNGGSATLARLSYPEGIALNSLDETYICDQANHSIRKINTTGIINTFAGSGAAGYSGDGGPATSSRLYSCSQLAFDLIGNIYVADAGNGCIRKITPTGNISTYAGNGTPGYSGDGGSITTAQFNTPSDIIFDSSWNMYIADYGNHRIRKITPSGIISTFAGTGVAGFSGDGGAAAAAKINFPLALAIDRNGNIYIADNGNNRIRKISTSGIITTVAGNGTVGYSGDGGAATAAKLNRPSGVEVDSVGNLYISDSYNNRIREVILCPTPVLGTIMGVHSACSGTALILSDTTIGGVWSSSDTLVATISNSGTVSALNFGTAIITYSKITSCGYAKTTDTIVVTPLPNAGIITGTPTLCPTTATTLVNVAPGGTWTCSSATISVTGGVVTGVTAGSAVISYSISNSCGTAIDTMMVTVNPLPDAGTITGTPAVCVADITTLNTTITGGTWTSSSTTATVIDSVVTGVTAGNTIISYAVTTTCGTAIDTMMITVNPLPVAGTITGTPVLCSATVTTLANVATGGFWTSSSATVTVTGGVVTGATAGTSIISYSVTNGCGTAVDTMMVTVNSLPDAGVITGTPIVCEAATSTLSTIATGGIWTSSTTSATVTGGMVTGVTAGSSIISYSVNNSCGTAVDTMMITINPLPDAGVITGTPIVCAAATTTLGNIATGGTWTSSTSSATVAGGVVSGATAGNAIISYSVTNSCGTAVDTMLVTVNPLPDAGTITGTATVCAAASTTLSNSATGGTWTSSTSAATLVGGVVSGVTAGSTVISYSVTNSCGTTVDTMMVTVNPLPVAGVITGATNVCIGATITLSNTATGGIWAASIPAATVAGGVVTGVSAGSVVIFYTVTNSCGNASDTMAVTVVAPADAGTITGATSVCVGAATSLANTATGGAWSSSGTSATVNTSGVVSGTTAGSVTISYIVTNTCGADTTVFSMTVNALPDAGIIKGPDSLCSGDVITLTDAATGVWSSANTGIATVSTTGVVTGVTSGGVGIIYTATNSCGTDTATKLVWVRNAADCNTGISTTSPETINIGIYPNPNNGTFTLAGTWPTASGKEVTVEIVNMLGQVVYKNNFTHNGIINEQIQAGNTLASGTYVLMLHGNGGSRIIHFVVKE